MQGSWQRTNENEQDMEDRSSRYQSPGQMDSVSVKEAVSVKKNQTKSR